ncbi:MAG: hypothetical protein ACP5JR_06000, partial [Thermoplasmata archaeon]
NLSDGVEVMEMHTDPRKDDSDGDRLKDGYEVRFGMNPLSNDTDGDQWDDWNEFNYWYKCVQNESLSASYCSTPDVDGDSITDYQEVKGYNVRIITVWDENGTPVYSDREMHGDPLSAYKQPSGAWTKFISATQRILTTTQCERTPNRKFFIFLRFYWKYA